MGESFIQEAAQVIEGFIDEELFAKIDVMERCYMQSFTPFPEDRPQVCKLCLADLSARKVKPDDATHQFEELGCVACMSKVVQVLDFTPASFTSQQATSTDKPPQDHELVPIVDSSSTQTTTPEKDLDDTTMSIPATKQGEEDDSDGLEIIE